MALNGQKRWAVFSSYKDKTARCKKAPCSFGGARVAEAVCFANRPVEPKALALLVQHSGSIRTLKGVRFSRFRLYPNCTAQCSFGKRPSAVTILFRSLVMNVYEDCPVFQNERYVLRLVEDGDIGDLLKVYSDVKAVPLFNGDNCHGDDFHYTTPERMKQALNFWKDAYTNGWFVRFAVIDKETNEVIGTVEEFRREEKDFFTDCGLLRLDLRSDYEMATEIRSILSLIAFPSFYMFGCAIVATKAIPTAKERISALTALGFSKSEEPLVGHDGTKYYDYWVLDNRDC